MSERNGCSAFRSWAEITGVWAIAIAWPIFQGATSGPDAFTRSRIGVADLVAFALVTLFAIPAVAWAVERLVNRFSPEAARTVRATLIGLLLGAVVWQAAGQLGLPSALAFVVFLAAAVLIGLLYVRTPFMRSMAGLLAFSIPVVLVGLFLSAPARQVLSGQADVPDTTANGTPVVVVTFDEFPLASIEDENGRIDPRFENLAALERRATWYPNTYSVADETTAAVPAILASKRGKLEDPPGSGRYPDNLFTLLAGAGYRVDADENVTDLCPHDLCSDRGSASSRVSRLILNGVDNSTTLPGDLAEKATEPLVSKANRLTPQPAKVVDQFVAGLRPGRDQLDFVHVMLPHVPWRYLPSGQQFEAPLAPGLDLEGGDQSVPWESPQSEIDSAFQRQQLQVAFADRELGRIIARMKQLGIWDESMFVVVADHGGSFQSGLMRRHADAGNAGWILPVPLFVKYPGQSQGRTDPRPAETLDVLPTVAAVTGLEPMPEFVGSSLRGAAQTRPEVQVESTAEGTFTIDRSQVERLRREAVRLRDETFEGGSPWAMGGHADLIGRPAETLPDATPVEAGFDPPWPVTIVNPKAKVLPAYVTGRVKGAPSPEDTYALSLDGTVVGTFRTFGEGYFAFTLPPDRFRSGENEIVVLALRRPSASN
ncbi:MAG: sulfatase-like hydrolase/transferase [Solirubrobacterales bacterium]|nr:sulfatase-like hydrolase/transferase [Solirubrobacterales bacterium]